MQQDLSSIPTSRAEALKVGAKFYFTGKPCKCGHLEKKYTCNKTCVVCYAIKRREKYQANKDNEKATAKAWRDKNQGRLVEYAQAYYAENKETRIANLRSWQKRNSARCAMKASQYRAQKRIARPAWHGDLDNLVMEEAFDLSARRASLTGIKWDVDHMIPLASNSACGLHVGVNIQVIPAALNKRKGNKMILTEPGQWINAL